MIMWKVLRTLQEQGTVMCEPGKGVFIRELVTVQAPGITGRAMRPPAQRWQCVAASMRQDILGGVYKSGEQLPGIKEMAARYGVCAQTMRRAAVQAITEGYIARERRLYTVTSMPHAAGTKRVLLIAAGTNGTLAMVTPRTQEHIRALEWECSAFGVQLLQWCFYDVVNNSETEISSAIHALMRNGTLAGVLAWSVGIGDTGRLAGILNLFIVQGIPTAMLDETTEPQHHQYDPHHGLYRVFHLGVDCGDGERVGRFLLDNGHRRAAFIALSSSAEPAAKVRFQGVARAFAKGGASGGVSHFTFNDTHGLPVAMNIMNTLQRFYQAATTFMEETGPQSYLNSQIRQPDTVEASVVNSVPKLIMQAREIETLFTTVNPLSLLFDRVAANTGITAWVGENDVVALAICDYLKRRGIAVPGSVSVIGFDDSLAASEQQLTSYNFNGRAVLHAMMRFALGMIYEPGGTSRTEFTAVGYVAQRGTTGGRRTGKEGMYI